MMINNYFDTIRDFKKNKKHAETCLLHKIIFLCGYAYILTLFLFFCNIKLFIDLIKFDIIILLSRLY